MYGCTANEVKLALANFHIVRCENLPLFHKITNQIKVMYRYVIN